MNMKKKIPLLFAFLMPLFIALVICIDHGVFPFGNQCILHVDMYHQYCPFFTELADKLKEGKSLLYSWNIGLGVDFISLYAYYLASPLNWLLILCPDGFVIEFMTVLVVLKIALCGLTFAYYLREHFGINHFAISVFGTAYALSAFMAAYAWNIMWTDCLVLAPLAVLGLERLIRRGDPRLYYSALALSILSNYYISIMVCIFLVIWFFIFWMEHRETGFRAWIRFAVYSILAGGTGAVLIIPTAIVLGRSGAQGISFPESMKWYFNILAELARHSALTDAYTGQNHWPDIYCGAFVLVFVVLYVLNRRIPWKRKVACGLFAVFFVVSFANNYLDFVWHGLHFPTSLPGRQSFLYTFLLLVISYEAFLNLRANRLWHVLAAGVCNGIFLFAVYRFVIAGEAEYEGPDALGLGVTVLLVVSYLVLIVVCLLGKRKLRRFALAIGCFVVIGELTLNFDMTGLATTSRSAYVNNWKDYGVLLSAAENSAQQEGELFYRTEELERKTKNDAALFGYRSATQFSSLMNLEVSHFYQAVGMEGGKNFYCASGATPLFSAMFSIRYILADNPWEENSLRSYVAQSGDYYLYENRYVLPLGFMMSEDVIEAWDYKEAGDIEAQNRLARLLGAETDMFLPVPSVSAPGESVVEVDEDGFYYATYQKIKTDRLTEEVSDGRTRSFAKASHGYTLDFGYCTAGSTISLKNDQDETVALTAYRMDTEALQTAFDTLNRQTMELTSFKERMIEGTIQVEEPGRLIFTVADEDGWTLLVDGEEREPESFGGAFISVHLEPGEHRIQLRYETPGLRLGAGLTGACIAVFVLLLLIYRRRMKKDREEYARNGG